MVEPDSDRSLPKESSQITISDGASDLTHPRGKTKFVIPAFSSFRDHSVTWIGRLRPLQFVGVLLLIIFPSAMVILDRWLGVPDYVHLESDAVCNANFFCKLGLPDYFYPIFVCFFILVIIFTFMRNDPIFCFFLTPGVIDASLEAATLPIIQVRIASIFSWLAVIGFQFVFFRAIFFSGTPGWDLFATILCYLAGRILAEVDFHRFIAKFLKDYKVFVTLLLSHLSLILLLASIYSKNGFSWLWLVLFIAAWVNLYSERKRIPTIFWIISLALVLFTFNMNNWLFLFQGDEYSFYEMARYIGQSQSLAEIGSNLFNGSAVYQSHPYFSSVIHAIFMRLLGFDTFGWRFSNMYLSAVSSGLFYLFFRRYLPNRIALFSAFFLATSEYLMSFSKIGYNNLQALFAMALVFAVAGWAVQSKRPISFTLLGFSIALCFYVYPAALYVAPVPIFFLLLFLPPNSKGSFRLWLYMLAPLFITIFPLMIQLPYWQAKVGGTIFNNQNLVSNTDTVYVHFASNLVFTLFSFLYIVEESHFVYGSYVDPLTAAFAFTGVAILIAQVGRQKFVKFIFFSFTWLVILVGTSHDRAYPTATRMHLLLPYFTLFAAVGLYWVIEKVKILGANPEHINRFLSVICGLVVILNLVQANVLSPNFYAKVSQFEQLYLRTVQRSNNLNKNAQVNFIFLTDSNFDPWIYHSFQEIYSDPRPNDQVIRLVVDQDLDTISAKKLIQDNFSLVIIQPNISDELASHARSNLVTWGKQSCPIADRPDGNPRFTLWYSPGMDALCQ